MKKTFLLVLALVLVFSAGAVAGDLTGEEILDTLNFSTILSGSGSAELEMITENARGVQRKYSLKVFLKMDDHADKQFLEYLAPADVRGTKFLSISQDGEENQMWLYMPALGRERRIAAHMTGDSFMGTDFTYDEISGNFDYNTDYSVERLADETEQGLDCYVLKLAEKSGLALYELMQMWVWKDELVPVKIEFSSEKQLLKTLTLSDFRLASGELVPHYITMDDNIQGTKTILEITEMGQEDLSDDIFTVRNLRR